jgi:hypothetical protein
MDCHVVGAFDFLDSRKGWDGFYVAKEQNIEQVVLRVRA